MSLPVTQAAQKTHCKRDITTNWRRTRYSLSRHANGIVCRCIARRRQLESIKVIKLVATSTISHQTVSRLNDASEPANYSGLRRRVSSAKDQWFTWWVGQPPIRPLSSTQPPCRHCLAACNCFSACGVGCFDATWIRGRTGEWLSQWQTAKMKS